MDIISISLSLFFWISVWIREWHAHRIFTFESKCDQSIGRLAVSVHVRVGNNIIQNRLPKLFFVIVHYFCKLYESSRRKPGWRFTAGSELKDKFMTLRVVLASFSRSTHSIWVRHFFCLELYESSRRTPGWRFTAGSEYYYLLLKQNKFHKSRNSTQTVNRQPGFRLQDS